MYHLCQYIILRLLPSAVASLGLFMFSFINRLAKCIHFAHERTSRLLPLAMYVHPVRRFSIILIH